MSYGVDKERLLALNASRPELGSLTELGGVNSIASKLKTDLRKGLTTSQVNAERKKAFGENVYPEQEAKSLLHFVLEAFEDQTLRILIACAVVSLVFGLFFSHEEGGWVDSVGIFFAIFLVVTVGSWNNWQKEHQFRDLNRVKEDRSVKVIRDGETRTLPATELLVGDLVKLDTGDYVPADGIVVQSFGIECDESNLTGEAESVAKNETDPFLLAGTQLVDGVGSMLITAVGSSTEWGRTLLTIQEEETEDTPLEKQLEKVADTIGFCGLSIAILMFVVLAGKLTVNVIWTDAEFDMEFVGKVLKYLVHSVSLIVAAVPEGLPLAVTISLAFSTKKMLKDQNLVRNLAACETMGSATTICSDKTGTLTTNRMTTTEAWIAGDVYTDLKSKPSKLSTKVVDALATAISVNSTANITVESNKPPNYIGNKTECAMLLLLNNLGINYHDVREVSHNKVEHIFTFSSDRKCMSTVLRNGESTDSHIIYTKGASEIVSALCNRYMTTDGSIKNIDKTVRSKIESEIDRMAKSGLRTICVAQNTLTSFSAADEAPEKNLVCLAILGIKDPLRVEVPPSIEQCKKSGILVRMVTGDNINTAKHIAQECGIYDPKKGLAMEGPEFRNMKPEEMEAILPRLQVLARSTPSDKHLLVTTLKKMGDVVAVTGDGTNDAAALKAANVGLSMGIAGTEVAKEASDIVIMDDNFASIVKSVLWGRSVYENVRKFLQFQITINIAAVLITFIGSVMDRGFPLTAVQLLWINLIMDTFAALALATEPPSTDLLDRKPHGSDESIITGNMWKNIIVQAAVQLAILLPLINAHTSFFGPLGTPENPNPLSNKQSEHDYTLVFNVFVWCQLFNLWNARKINNEFNIFENIAKSWVFVVILAVTAIGQVLITQYGGYLGFGTHGLTSYEWLCSIALGSLAVPFGFVLRFIPIGTMKAH